MILASPGAGGSTTFEPKVIDAVARHECLPSNLAQSKVETLLDKSWGPPAIRQMIRDEIDSAVAQSRWPDVEDLLDTYQWCCSNMPAGEDRRTRLRLN